MIEVILDEQYEDESRLSVRKKIHRMHSVNSVNKVDTQYEAIRRLTDATSVLDIGCGSGDLLVKL